MKALIAEDEATNRLQLKRSLQGIGCDVTVCGNGRTAIELLSMNSYDVVLTDWMMPYADGGEVVRFVHGMGDQRPAVAVITSLGESARDQAIECGADSFVTKPIDVATIQALARGLVGQRSQPMPYVPRVKPMAVQRSSQGAALCIASSTGGPSEVLELFKRLPGDAKDATIFITQHGPPWMIELFAQRLDAAGPVSVAVAKHGESIQPGRAYCAPGDQHMRVDPEKGLIVLDAGPEINYVRPAADPMITSVVELFGASVVAVIMTGMGRDAGVGVSMVRQAGGFVIVQDPKTCVASGMPQTAIDVGAADDVLPPPAIPEAIAVALRRAQRSRKGSRRAQTAHR